MKRKGKTPLIVLLVLVCVAFCGFVASFLVDSFLNTVTTAAADKQPILNYITRHWEGIKAVFSKWTPAETTAGNPYWYFSYIAVGACAIFLVAIIVGIVVAAKKRQKLKILYVIPMILVCGIVVDTLGNYQMYVDSVRGMFIDKGQGVVANYLFYNITNGFKAFIPFIAGCCAIVAFILLFVVYGMGLAYINRYPNTVACPCEEAAPVEEIPAPVEEQQPVQGEYSMASVVPEEPVVVEEPTIEIEPVEDFAPVVEPEAVEEPAPEEAPKVEEPAPAPVVEQPIIDEAKLASMLKDLVRDIVRDEIARNNLNQPQPQPVQPNTITGATFAGPLVVQYFNGGIQGAVPAPAPAPAPAPVPAPKKEEPAPVKPAAPVPAPKKEEPAQPAEASKEPVEKKPIERIPFTDRLLAADKELQEIYNELKNELLSWGVKSRVSNNGDTFRLHTKTYAKITVAGKSLKFHFALDPNDYKDSTIPVGDAGEKNLYAEIPLVFKVKSALSVKRAKQLIQDCCEKDGLEQGEVESVNWIKELKAEKKSK